MMWPLTMAALGQLTQLLGSYALLSLMLWARHALVLSLPQPATPFQLSIFSVLKGLPQNAQSPSLFCLSSKGP